MTTYERIRRIFLKPEQAYLVSDAARLLGYSDQEIIAAIEGGDMSLEPTRGLPSVPWEEVALAAAERWPQEVIEAALGDEASALPDLIRLTDLHVRVPLFGVFVLGRIAQRDGTTINAVVARQLVDLAVADAEVFEQSIPGIGAAIRWPLS